jgi:hypothetical protein
VVKWCSKCEDHFSLGDWLKGKDVCDRCHAGLNDEYLTRKKVSATRVAAALERQKDPKNWGDGAPLVAYLKWVDSPAYANRFDKQKEKR